MALPMRLLCPTAVLFLLIAAPADVLSDELAAEGQGAAEPLYRPEVIDDPPAPASPRDDLAARSPGGRYRRGSYVSIQVNVDAVGQNILGDAANEPSIAIDPLNPDKIVIGWRQFDNVVSNFRQAGWAFSTDGGQSWTFPGLIEPGVFRSDPVLDTDSAGTFYYESLKDTFRMDVFRSLDSGQSWPLKAPAFGGDKNWMAIDKTGGAGEGHVYGNWQRNFNCCGPDLFSRSTDGAESFENPVFVPDGPSFGTMTVGGDGAVYISGTLDAGFTTFIVARSDDAQDSSSGPTFTSSEVSMGGAMGFADGPNPAGLLGQSNVVVDSSGGPTQGNVYLMGSVIPPGSDPLDVTIARSTDRGTTFSPPVRINDDPLGTDAYQWFGTLAVAPNGRLDAVWNDTRTSGTTNISELFYAYSWDGGDTWSENLAVSPAFDSFVGWPNQDKLGDYYTMISDDLGGSLAWAATFNGEQDVYFLRVFPDCNGNGTSDVEDIQSGDSADGNGNHIPDECEGGLLLIGPDPGIAGQVNTFIASGASPRVGVRFFLSAGPGNSTIPGCPGLSLDMAKPRRLGRSTSDGSGVATLDPLIPGRLGGRTIRFQALDRSACEVSNLVIHPFP